MQIGEAQGTRRMMTRQPMRGLLVLLIALCCLGASAVAEATSSTDADAAKAKWDELGAGIYHVQFDSYLDATQRTADATIQRSNFGIHVRDDQILAEFWEVAPADQAQVMTIDALFDVISNGTVAAVFDATHGYPLSITQASATDPSQTVLDVQIQRVLLLDTVIFNEVTTNLLRWQTSGPSDYTMGYRNHHQAAIIPLPPQTISDDHGSVQLTVSVANGFLIKSITVTTQSDASGGSSTVDVDVTATTRDYVQTVDALFRELEFRILGPDLAALSDATMEPVFFPTLVNVVYDQQLGYPNSIEIVATTSSSVVSLRAPQTRLFNVSLPFLEPDRLEELSDARKRWDDAKDKLGLYGTLVRSITVPQDPPNLPIDVPRFYSTRAIQVENDEIYSVQSVLGVEVLTNLDARPANTISWRAIIPLEDLTDVDDPTVTSNIQHGNDFEHIDGDDTDKKYFTVDQLFGILGSALRELNSNEQENDGDDDGGRILAVWATYDAANFGVPRAIQIQYQAPKTKNGDDGEVRVFIYNVRALLPYSLAMLQIEEQKRRWANLDMVDYSFIFQLTCFCLDEVVQPRLVEIRNSTDIQSVQTLPNARGVGERDAINDMLPVIRPMTEMFEFLKQALEDSPQAFSFIFDPIYGHPTSIHINPALGISDNSYVAEISSVTPMRQSELQTNLTNAIQTWESYDMQNYSFAFVDRCFCEVIVHQWIAVRDGKLLNVDIDNMETIAPDAVVDVGIDDAMTIPDLFDLIQDSINTLADRLEVEFDAKYGHPTRIFVQQDEDLADAFASIFVSMLTPYSALLPEVAQQKLLWEQQQITSYTYSFTRSCECLTDGVPVEVVVEDGVIQSWTLISPQNKSVTGATRSGASPCSSAFTVSDLLAIIEDAIQQEAPSIQVDYDFTGRPLSIFIDYSRMIADDEFIVSMDYMGPPSESPSSAPTVAPTYFRPSLAPTSSNETQEIKSVDVETAAPATTPRSASDRSGSRPQSSWFGAWFVVGGVSALMMVLEMIQ